MIKAIEASYSGHRFRSRSEARWAVWFDAMSIAYEYEPQGYAIGSECYLPDFFVPSWHVYFEVKPSSQLGEPLLSERDRKKVGAFSAYAPLIISGGRPGFSLWYVLNMPLEKTIIKGAPIACLGCGHIAFLRIGWASRNNRKIIEELPPLPSLTVVNGARPDIYMRASNHNKLRAKCPTCRKPTLWGLDDIQIANDRATAARFEFGESG